MTSHCVKTTVTQQLFYRDLLIPLQSSTTRGDLARIALTMEDLSMFPAQHLTLLSPSPSKKNDLAQTKDTIAFDCASLPGDSLAMFTKLSNQFNELQTQLQQERHERLAEQQKLNEEQQKLKARISTLEPITRRILTDAYLSVRGYRFSLGSRAKWIHENIAGLLPHDTGTTEPEFELKLEKWCQHGDAGAHSTQTLAIALSLDDLASPDEDFECMFSQCFGHGLGEELEGRISSTLVEIGKDGVANLQKTQSPVP